MGGVPRSTVARGSVSLSADAQVSAQPTDEQLACFAVVRIYGYLNRTAIRLALRMFEISPIVREQWLRRHRETQEALRP